MKTWLMIIMILGILSIGTVFAVSLNQNDSQVNVENETPSTCGFNSGQGGCTQTNMCQNSECGVKTTGSCGCRK